MLPSIYPVAKKEIAPQLQRIGQHVATCRGIGRLTCIQSCLACGDQNYAFYEHKGTGQYRIVPWDYEGTWGRNSYGMPCAGDLVRIDGYNALTEKLLADPAVRRRYRDLLERLVNNEFTESNLMPIVYRLHDAIREDVRRDSTRQWPFHVFEGEPEWIRRYIRERRQVVQRELTRL